jgi:hypothetical protein
MNTLQAQKQIENSPDEMRSAMLKVIDGLSDGGLLMASTDKDSFCESVMMELTAVIYKRALELGDEQ